MRSRTVLGIVLLAGVTGFAADNPVAPAASLTVGDAHVTAPPGWRHVETKPGANQVSAVLIVPPDNTEKSNLAILVVPGQDLNGAQFVQALDAVLKAGLAPNEHLVQYSELPLRKGGEYEFATRSMIVADDTGRRSVRVCFGANANDRLELLIVSADSRETLKRYEADVASVLNSYSFDPPASRAANPNGATHAPARADSGVRTRARVAEGESVLLCTDRARLDAAMDFAKYGDSYNALRALRNDAFFRVNGPASLEVGDSELDSRWPKVFVTVVDGDSAGRSGWVVRSELKDLKPAAK